MHPFRICSRSGHVVKLQDVWQEARELGQKQEDVATRLQLEMLTPDERDEATSVLVEIRPGVGGDEACLWAEDCLIRAPLAACLLGFAGDV